MDIKITMVKSFNWSLNDINQTDIVDLLSFIKRVNETSGQKPGQASRKGTRAYCDQVAFL